MIIKLGTLLHFILNIFSNKTYSYCQVNISKLYKRVTAMTYGLNQLRWHDDGSSERYAPPSVYPVKTGRHAV